jgi:hypothetical protein
MELFFLWMLMAVVVAMVAKSKGRSAIAWFFYGFLIWPIALVHALLLRQAEGRFPGFGPEPERPRTIPYVHPTRGGATASGPGGTSATPPTDALDAETLMVAAEWRAAGRQFAMIEAKEEARLRLLEKANQQPAPPPKPQGNGSFTPDPFRRAMFPDTFRDTGAGEPPKSPKNTPDQPRP